MMIWSRWGCFYKNEEAWLSLIASKKNIFNICGKKKEKTGQSFQWDTSSWGKMHSSSGHHQKAPMFTFSGCMVTDILSRQLGGDLYLPLKASVTHHANTHTVKHMMSQNRICIGIRDMQCRNDLSKALRFVRTSWVFPSYPSWPSKVHIETPHHHLQTSHFSLNFSSCFETNWTISTQWGIISMKDSSKHSRPGTDPSIPSETWESLAAGGSGRIHGLVCSKKWLCLLT